MSPKHSSLAFDEVKEQRLDHEGTVDFEPELNLIVKPRQHNSSTVQIVKISGKVTVSF